MPTLCYYTVLGDMPTDLTVAQTQGIVAGVLQQVMTTQGYDGDSVVTLTSANPNASLAHPQIPGNQLCGCDLQVVFPDTVDPSSTESFLATGLAFYSAGIGWPGNVSVTLTGTTSADGIATPTPIVQAILMFSSGTQQSIATADLS